MQRDGGAWWLGALTENVRGGDGHLKTCRTVGVYGKVHGRASDGRLGRRMLRLRALETWLRLSELSCSDGQLARYGVWCRRWLRAELVSRAVGRRVLRWQDICRAPLFGARFVPRGERMPTCDLRRVRLHIVADGRVRLLWQCLLWPCLWWRRLMSQCLL